MSPPAILTPSHPFAPPPRREVRGNVRRRGRCRWQARVYGGSRAACWVSVGVYETEEAAAQVVRRVLRAIGGRPASPLAVWHAARRLADNGWDVGGELGRLMPKWVCPDGRGGWGYRLKGGNGCDRGGFGSPEDAHRAAAAARGGGRPPASGRLPFGRSTPPVW
jgi:hypothetical protein